RFERERAVARAVVRCVTAEQLQLHGVPGRELVAVAVQLERDRAGRVFLACGQAVHATGDQPLFAFRRHVPQPRDELRERPHVFAVKGPPAGMVVSEAQVCVYPVATPVASRPSFLRCEAKNLAPPSWKASSSFSLFAPRLWPRSPNCSLTLPFITRTALYTRS